jgi:hypothetical protein
MYLFFLHNFIVINMFFLFVFIISVCLKSVNDIVNCNVIFLTGYYRNLLLNDHMNQ